MNIVSEYVFCIIFMTANAGGTNLRHTGEPPSFPAIKENKLLYPTLVTHFYAINGNQLFWCRNDDVSYNLRCTLKQAIDSAQASGLDKSKYHYDELLEGTAGISISADSPRIKTLDRFFTDAAIAWCADLYRGTGIGSHVSFDGISGKYIEQENNYLVRSLAVSDSAPALAAFMQSLVPNQQEYSSLKTELQYQSGQNATVKCRQLSSALNIFRWIHHFKFEKCVVINIASATFRYYESDSLQLASKVVVGKPSTRTPRFAAWCNEVVLYPYWNVPRSIAVKELLPLFKRIPSLIDTLDMQVLNELGVVIDHHALNWASFSPAWFPFRVRQATGCNNALGVVKFNLISPYSVYMHDTNLKSAFLTAYRYYSHGCIRVENPVGLAGRLLPRQVDSSFLKACYKDQLPVTLRLDNPVPVFVVYATAEANLAGIVSYYRDIYHLAR